ncbi:hypothetical protein FQ085_06600 [Planococcus sp. ANT_H30]|uniref:hypothetical protein n=1 Tax=Planococcus sp. ANT_H30 TaxID=2597347 RepID=UPI0011ED6834|nr:hypothetical protein [Planococcus sp. ANT_H30]KAA0957716.1 hypothetical protein FQ085_06600 [Planococcus sp. ANT_H30]
MAIATVKKNGYMIEDLKNIKNRLLQSEMNEAEKKELKNVLLNVIDDVKASDPEFKVKFFTYSNNGHHETYLNYADMYLNKLYSDIENVISRLKMGNMNGSYIASILDKIIQTNLYMDSIQKYIDETSHLQEGNYEMGILKMSDRIAGEYTILDSLG